MIVSVRILQQGRKPKYVETTVSTSLTIGQIKQLWEAEQVLNSLPGANLRVHIDVKDEDAPAADQLDVTYKKGM